jgi:predicted cobalt transporter CbtA
MNWSVDIKDLTGRQILWVITVIAAFGGLLYFLVAYKYTVAVGMLALAVIIYAKWHLAGKGR